MDKDIYNNLNTIDKILKYLTINPIKYPSEIASDLNIPDDSTLDDYLYYLNSKDVVELRFKEGKMYVVCNPKGVQFILDGKSFVTEHKRERTRAAKEWFDTYIGRWFATGLFLIAAAGFIIQLTKEDTPIQVIKCDCAARDNNEKYSPKLEPKDTVIPNNTPKSSQ